MVQTAKSVYSVRLAVWQYFYYYYYYYFYCLHPTPPYAHQSSFKSMSFVHPRALRSPTLAMTPAFSETVAVCTMCNVSNKWSHKQAVSPRVFHRGLLSENVVIECCAFQQGQLCFLALDCFLDASDFFYVRDAQKRRESGWW
jgi:hypothetical protein